ncbi:glycosyltransferase family 4 protein [Jeotgalibacillus sp. R-1-5s-1]|uniref:glycosyltransferase family 4 protein n=1 Tax=Jeotgalibacillus sp. R-1-5s-1 TaxID=2555897 RepID=UPI00106D1E58|nr:glycosyltransferase family 4 protein [Jeotgalibacillus sp. R-1-5s-1]TFD95762.1 glycosyltransferase WbuB [Jeotgalibacillus sp. R-1-5s-1]
MKIIYLCQHFPPETGAPQIRVYEVSKELIKQGHQVEVLTAFPHHPHGIIPDEYKGKFYEKEMWDGIPVHRSWIYPSPKGSFWKRLISYFSFTFSAFYSIMKSKPADVIICNSPPLFLGITGYLGAKMKRAKFVFNVADIWPESAVKLGLVKNKTFISMAEKLEMFLYKKSWKIAAATDGIAEYMIQKGKKPDDVFVLPNGVNTDFFSPVEADLEVMNQYNLHGKKVFTYAGNLGYAQGLDCILKAASRLKHRDDIVFLMVGDGPEREKLMNLKEELNLTNVQFTGHVKLDQMPQFFSVSDYSIVPLRNLEIFKGARPSKIFPALSMEKPVLYCGEGESADIIENAEVGRVAIPENDEDIAKKIEEMASIDQITYAEMGKRGRELVKAHYSWKRIVDDMMIAFSNDKKS